MTSRLRPALGPAAMPATPTKQGPPSTQVRVALLANLETLGVVGPQPRMPTSSEVALCQDSRATLAPTPREDVPLVVEIHGDGRSS